MDDKQNNVKLSVVIPIYNAQGYLSRCLNSIVNQKCSLNYELLLIDDGSTDISLDICLEYARNYHFIRVFHNDNHGVSYSRNFGIQESRGEHITFIDADDWIEDGYLISFFDLLESDADIVIQGILSDYSGSISNHYKYDDIYLDESLVNQGVVQFKILHDGCPYAKLFKTSIIKKNNLLFDVRLNMHEDHIFVLGYYSFCANMRLSSNMGYHYMRQQNHFSLSCQSHSSKDLLLASDLFFIHYEKIFAKFSIFNDCYKSELLTHYGLAQRLRAILNLYLEKTPSNLRQLTLINEKRLYGDLFVKYYKTNSFLRYAFCVFFLYSPMLFFDFMLKILIKNEK